MEEYHHSTFKEDLLNKDGMGKGKGKGRFKVNKDIMRRRSKRFGMGIRK
jgi:hypothetical protein